MRLIPSFSASARVWEKKSWVFALEEIGYAGWEVVADGKYSLENPENRREIEEIFGSTNLLPTVHAPYSDLNLASINYPIWRESIRQVCSCVGHAAALGAKRVTFHPGYVSPVGKLVPEKVWAAQKDALAEIGQAAVNAGTLACLENMVGIREFLCRYPEELLGITEGIEGIGITIDIGHANTVGKVPEFLRILGRAQHLHVHDNHGEHDEHLPLGEGTIRWEEAGSAAKAYSGIAVVEGRSLEEARRSLVQLRRWFV